MSALAVTALVSWLIGEAFGAFMLRARLRHRSSVPRWIYVHAVLAFFGLLGWIGFVLTSSAALAWLAIGFLAVAVGIGLSTLTLWPPDATGLAGAGASQPGYPATLGITSDEMLARALEDEALTTKLVDELVASVLAAPEPAYRRSLWRPARWSVPRPTALVHAMHGALAMNTVLFAVLAAVSAS